MGYATAGLESAHGLVGPCRYVVQARMLESGLSANPSGSPQGESSNPVLLARQPIFTPDRDVCGYELLHRRPGATVAQVTDNMKATNDLLATAFIDIGIGQLVGDLPAFINVDHHFLLSGAAKTLPPDRVVLEILETTEVTHQVIQAVGQLRREGFTFALDDFVWTPEFEPLMDFAQIIKVDVLGRSLRELMTALPKLRRPGVTLLAEKVEDDNSFKRLKDLGFTMFQGYFFSKPDHIDGRRLSPEAASRLHLLALLHDPASEVFEIAKAIKHDTALSINLLRLVNSVFIGLHNPVNSIERAVLLLGFDAVRRWGSLVVLVAVSSKPMELSRSCLIRARMCEIIATRFRMPESDSAFTVGLLSGLDAMTEMPMEIALESIPVSESVAAALMHREGQFGQLLNAVIAYEKADWDAVASSGLPLAQIAKVYREAVAWTRMVETGL
jgi:EAL and modified HD-GYP domain-containing signal transduction protein